MSQNRLESAVEGVSRKPYEQPQLQVYGDLGKITGAVGVTGATDGGMSTGAKNTRP